MFMLLLAALGGATLAVLLLTIISVYDDFEDPESTADYLDKSDKP